MARRWNSWRESAGLLAIHSSFGVRRGLAPVDAVFRIKHGANPTVLRIRHHPLPLNGRGHHLQARLGVYGGNCRGACSLFSDCRVGLLIFPSAIAPPSPPHSIPLHTSFYLSSPPTRPTRSPSPS